MATHSEIWFETVKRHTNHWNRVSDNKIVLWFSGYKPSTAHEAEINLMKLGGFVLSMDFDSHSGKTAVIIKEPKNVLAEREF